MSGLTARFKDWFKRSANRGAAQEPHPMIDPAPSMPATVEDRDVDRLSIDIEGGDPDGPLAAVVAASFKQALALETKVSGDLMALEGMSGKKYRMFINNLIGNLADARYLEIGSWMGSTACSAMFGNQAKVVCIDNWTEFGGPKDQFFENVERFKTNGVEFSFHEADFRSIDYSALGRFNVFLFDGPHGHQDQYDGLALPLVALDEEFVFIVDDWNAPFVRDGTERAIRDLGLSCLYKIIVRTTQNDEHAIIARQQSDWHNGYHIGVYRRDLDATRPGPR